MRNKKIDELVELIDKIEDKELAFKIRFALDNFLNALEIILGKYEK